MIAFQAIYHLTVSSQLNGLRVGEVTYSFYAVDYSMGFCSRFLPGALYQALFPRLSQTFVNLWETIWIVAIWILLAFMLEKFYFRFRTHRATPLFLFLFLCGPCTFGMFCNEFGMLDVHWLPFLFCAILCLQEKRCYPLLIVIPPILALIHYNAVICQIPFLLLLMLWQAARCRGGERKLLFVCTALALLCGVGMTAYFVLYEKQNLVWSMEDFNQILRDRGATYLVYFDYVLYGVHPDDVAYVDAGNGVLTAVLQQIVMTLTLINVFPLLFAFFITSPVLYVIARYFLCCIKSADSRCERLALWGMLLMFPATVVANLLFSTDVIRWFSHAFLCLFASFLYVLYRTRGAQWETVEARIKKIPQSATAVYAFIYMMAKLQIRG